MNPMLTELAKLLEGAVHTDTMTRDLYSHDASIYEIVPDGVLYPKNTSDIKKLVQFVTEHKQSYPTLSITARSAGTDMSGAAIGNSLVIDMTKHFSAITSLKDRLLHVQPGVFMRDIDPLLARHGLFLGSVPASRAINTIGGMVGNNSGGEQSLRYGNTQHWVRSLKVVLADGNEYVVKPLIRTELMRKMQQPNFEGKLYKSIYELLEAHYDVIKNARPHVNKNSMGYNLWSIWDRGTGIFDLTHLFTGSQGTLGIITDIEIEAIPQAPHSGLLIAYLTDIKKLDRIIPMVVAAKPATFEGFDDVTFNLGIKYFARFRKEIGTKEWLKQQSALLGSVAKFKGHLPNIVLMIEFDGTTYQEVNDKLADMQHMLRALGVRTEIEGNEQMSEAFWHIRRASLSLLREKVKHKYASPFIDDMTVQPRYIQEFFPKVRKIIRHYKLPATISGHFGDGNFHIVPLLSIGNPKDQKKLEPAMRELIPIVKQYGGTLAGEHNDGMIRGPWLPAMFGQEVFQLFKQVKELCDPLYIFNPHKKTDAAWEYSMDHLRKK